MRPVFLAITLCILCHVIAYGQDIRYTQEDSTRVESFLRRMAEVSDGNPTLSAGKLFIGVPYVAATLEHEPEVLTVNLREMDCTTLVETVIALVRTALSSERTPSFDTFCDELRLVRYRNGVVEYINRLHYIADWKFENEKRGIISDVTGLIEGNKPLPLHLDYISTHPSAYPPLMKHPEWIREIKEQEEIANKQDYCYIPKENLALAESSIRDGDILAFVTSIKGLDVSHLGIACHEGGRLTFLHASSSAKEVIVNPLPLREYLSAQKKVLGVWVMRQIYTK